MTDSLIPWPTPKTDGDLAELVGVSRRRVYKMRADGAPAGRDLVAWHQWMRETGRTAIAERLAKLLDPEDEGGPENAPGAPVGGPTSAPSDLPKDFDTKTPAEQEVYWRTRRSMEQALAAEASRRKIDRELIEFADVRRFGATIAASSVAALSDTVWRALRPHLDGLAMTHPDLLKILRRQHDQAVITVRTTLAATLARELRKLLHPEAP